MEIEKRQYTMRKGSQDLLAARFQQEGTVRLKFVYGNSRLGYRTPIATPSRCEGIQEQPVNEFTASGHIAYEMEF